MNELTIFNNPEFGEIRTVDVNNETFFVSKDVGEILGYNNPRDAVINHVDVEDRASVEIHDGRQIRHMIAVNESGLYALIMNSKLPSAKKFKHWVTSEVIPSIRKNGMYMTDAKAYDVVNNPNGLADLLSQVAEQLRQKDIRIAEMRPKEIFADAITSSETNILIRDLAKILVQNGVDTGEKRLYAWLKKEGYLLQNKMPSQEAARMKLFFVKEGPQELPSG